VLKTLSILLAIGLIISGYAIGNNHDVYTLETIKTESMFDKSGFWSGVNEYPANVQLNPEQFKAILRGGNVDVSNVIIN
jgi:hypothetical protein